MKLVLKIGSTCLDDPALLLKFVKVVSQLSNQHHRLAVIHGGTRMVFQTIAATHEATPAGPGANGDEFKDAALKMLAGRVNKMIVAMLSTKGITAFGLCGTDGNIVRLRKKEANDTGNGGLTEIVSVDPLWIESLSSQGAVPVLANVGIGPDGQPHCMDADQLAGACAAAWDADALVLLTPADGPKDSDGSIIRWLDSEKINELTRKSTLNDNISSKLHVCRVALARGVRRTRILPLTHIESLEQFYFSRIDGGTEVITASGKAANG